MRREQTAKDRAVFIDSLWNYLLLIITSLLFWTAGYAESVGYPIAGSASYTPAWNKICTLLPNVESAYITGAALLLGSAFLIHRANYALIIIREKTYMPFLLYITFISGNTVFFPFTSVSVASICLIIAFYLILSTYDNTNSAFIIYNAALLIGLGSLLWIHIIWFIPVFWWGMYRFKSLCTRTFLASIIGIGTIYWLLLGWCIAKQDYGCFTQTFSLLKNFALPVFSEIRLIDLIYASGILAVATIVIVNIIINEYAENIRTRHFLFFIIFFCITAFCLAFIYRRETEEFLQISCIPISILTAHFFSTSSTKHIHKLYFCIIIIYILLSVLRSPWNFLPPDVLGD